MTYQTFYCYLVEGAPQVLENKPDNFEELPFNAEVNSPNLEIAELTFKTKMRIKEWQTEN